MVVLEESGMLTTGHNQYLQPDYLSPLPTTVSMRSIRRIVASVEKMFRVCLITEKSRYRRFHVSLLFLFSFFFLFFFVTN